MFDFYWQLQEWVHTAHTSGVKLVKREEQVITFVDFTCKWLKKKLNTTVSFYSQVWKDKAADVLAEDNSIWSIVRFFMREDNINSKYTFLKIN